MEPSPPPPPSDITALSSVSPSTTTTTTKTTTTTATIDDEVDDVIKTSADNDDNNMNILKDSLDGVQIDIGNNDEGDTIQQQQQQQAESNSDGGDQALESVPVPPLEEVVSSSPISKTVSSSPAQQYVTNDTGLSSLTTSIEVQQQDQKQQDNNQPQPQQQPMMMTMTVCYPSQYSLPATTSRSYRICGVNTHTYCQVFADRIVVGISQLISHHIGHWILSCASPSVIDPNVIDYDVTTLLGNTTTMTTTVGNSSSCSYLYEVYARRVTETIIEKRLIPGTDRMVVLLGISLLPSSSSSSSSSSSQQQQQGRNNDMERFRYIVDVLVNDLIRSTLMKVEG